MSVFLGVTSTRKPLRLEAGDKSFWCVFAGYKAQPNDLLLLHKTVYGIAQIYRIVSASYPNGQYQCEVRGMRTVDTILLANVKNPVRVAEMKANPILQEWGALRRNFQRTTFSVSDKEWEALSFLIVEKNPDLQEVMATLTG